MGGANRIAHSLSRCEGCEGATKSEVLSLESRIGTRVGEELLAYLMAIGAHQGTFLMGTSIGIRATEEGTAAVRESWPEWCEGMVCVAHAQGHSFICVDQAGAVHCDAWLFDEESDVPCKLEGGFVGWVEMCVDESTSATGSRV
jgi:hypothetical protein